MAGDGDSSSYPGTGMLAVRCDHAGAGVDEQHCILYAYLVCIMYPVG